MSVTHNNPVDTGIDGQEPKRLSGRTQAVGTSTGMPVWSMLLFGLPFTVAGLWGTLMGTGTISVDPSSVHAPMWVLTVFGLIFVFAGLMLWTMAFRQFRTERQRRRRAENFRSEPAMVDYPWDTSGYVPSRWKPVISGWSAAVFMTVFLSIFNWWAFWSDDGVLFVKIIVSIFDLILLFVWYSAFKSLVHALKFGSTKLEFGQFPYHTGDWFQAKVLLPAGLERVEGAKLAFRCVREFYEVRGHGENRSRRLVHEQIWAEEQEISGAEIGQWPRNLNATFVIPAAAPGSHIAAEKPVFWELEMELAVPGIDLKQRYLVPVYSKEQ